MCTYVKWIKLLIAAVDYELFIMFTYQKISLDRYMFITKKRY